MVTAAAIIIGNEILSGRTRDANLPYIAEHLPKIRSAAAAIQAADPTPLQVRGEILTSAF